MAQEDPRKNQDPGVPQHQDAENVSSSDADEQFWAMLCHISAFSGFFIPFGNIFGPLVVWLMKSDDMAFVDRHGKQALNFNITVTLVALVCSLLTLVVIGFVLLPVLVIAHLVLTIIATVQAYSGNPYEYPLTIEFVS